MVKKQGCVIFSRLCGLFLFTPLIISSVTPLYQTSLPRGARCNISTQHFDDTLLSECLLYYTNRVRHKYGLAACRVDQRLSKAAQAHSHEMAQRERLSHSSPVEANSTLQKRLEKAGMHLAGTTFGENLGVDYILAIAKIYFYQEEVNGTIRYYNAKTRKRIVPQTYSQFASAMVQSWLDSPRHRDNLLNKAYTGIGFGAVVGTFNSLEAIYVTQNFVGSLR